jgi:hypothetical protein
MDEIGNPLSPCKSPASRNQAPRAPPEAPKPARVMLDATSTQNQKRSIQMQNPDTKNSELEKRIIKVSELIANNILESAFDFQRNTTQTKFLVDAIEILTPTVTALEEKLDRMDRKRDLADALINDIHDMETTGAYVTGIIMGLHLAGRSDLVPKIADIYARNNDDDRPFKLFQFDEKVQTATVEKH